LRTDQGLGLGSLVRRVHRRLKVWMGRDLIVPVQDHRATEYHGTNYGGWAVVPEALSSAAVVYSVGVGDDVAFDLSLIQRYGLTVHAFDPTPRSIAWVRSQSLPARFVFHEIGLGDHDGKLTLFPPAKASHMSFSMVNRATTGSHDGLELPVRRLSTMMRELGHARIDMLKMDIEGAEYDVLRSLDEDGIYPTQILVEFHHRFFPDGIARTRAAIQRLNTRHYRLVAVSPSGEEFTFLRSPP
jgi:FkbM family methyltransferase